jgi:hypothetical protein
VTVPERHHTRFAIDESSRLPVFNRQSSIVNRQSKRGLLIVALVLCQEFANDFSFVLCLNAAEELLSQLGHCSGRSKGRRSYIVPPLKWQG